MDDGGKTPAVHSGAMDSGAAAFAFLLQLLGVPADAAEILHQSGKPALDEADLLRAAKRFPVKARAIDSSLERLETTPMPALGALKSGGWLVIGKAAEGKVLVQDPLAAGPKLLTREDFAGLVGPADPDDPPRDPRPIPIGASASPGSWTR